jgi:hypothetical protein
MSSTLRKGGFNLHGNTDDGRRCHPCVPILGILALIGLSLAAGFVLLRFGVHEWYEKCEFF